ncbi:hypothetical protein Tcan_06472 [Toxocara canis]|uniref:Uncharacterized protein n=2 Tax=Toxocara canis TaxID=6265 RepID=A0A0B2UMM9_TOXCA|nr:hypothetical protein Tcan_06472 [Toxocara canis]VDM39193.1 unnamed protein product [Toxocara canis]
MMAPFSYSDSSSASCSSASSSELELDEVNPTRLLSMAIKKRRVAYSRKERDLREELLHTGLIQSLCKFLGEGRARRRKHRRSKQGRRRTSSSTSPVDRKREWSDNEAKAESNTVELTALNGQEHIVNSSFSAGCGDVIQPIIVQRSTPAADDGVSMQQFEQTTPPPSKVSRYDDADPFGLDALFAESYGRIIPSGCEVNMEDDNNRMFGVHSFDFRSSVSPVA